MGGNDEVNDIVRKEMSGVGIWPWLGRKLKHCLGCLFGWLIMAAVILGIVGFVVAKTGLVEIPVVSRFYHEPQPMRFTVPASTPIVDTLELQLSQAARAVVGGTVPAEITITLSESDLTRGLQDLAGAGAVGGLEFSNAQVAFSDGKAELFVRVKRSERTAPLRLRLVPALERKPIPLRVEKAYIGELPVWHRIIDALFNQALKTQLAGTPFASAITVKNLTIREGMLDVTVIVSGNLDTLNK